MLKAWGIPESCWSSVYFGVLKALVLILEKECHHNSTDGLARGNESKVARSKVFFSVLFSATRKYCPDLGCIFLFQII